MKKKVLFLTMVILLFVGLATAKTSIKPITKGDLKDLKGEWTGERRNQRGISARTDLNIYNARLPLTGELVLHFPKAAPKTWQFNNGRIEDGRLHVIWSDDRQMKLGLRKGDGKMEFEGDIQSMGFVAKVFFKKVK